MHVRETVREREREGADEKGEVRTSWLELGRMRNWEGRK